MPPSLLMVHIGPGSVDDVLHLHILTTPGAVCLDGSPGAFYVGTPAVPTTKWMIWGEGKVNDSRHLFTPTPARLERRSR
jgi:hypothetical protein